MASSAARCSTTTNSANCSAGALRWCCSRYSLSNRCSSGHLSYSTRATAACEEMFEPRRATATERRQVFTVHFELMNVRARSGQFANVHMCKRKGSAEQCAAKFITKKKTNFHKSSNKHSSVGAYCLRNASPSPRCPDHYTCSLHLFTKFVYYTCSHTVLVCCELCVVVCSSSDFYA